MIRTVPIPTRVNRMGLVQAGDGGSASSYQFTDGLSSDPQLSPHLQDLTPAQLQAALNGQAPTLADMIGPSLILTTCQQNYDPTICGPGSASTTNPLAMSLGLGINVPTWAWYAAGAAGAALLVGAMRR